MANILKVEIQRHVGVIEKKDEIFTGSITRQSDQKVVWIDECDRRSYMEEWVLRAFIELAKTGAIEKFSYGD